MRRPGEGGPIHPGKAYLVGEEGPELIRPMGAGVVMPAGQTASALRGRGMSIGKIEMVTMGATSNRSLERQRMQLDRSLRKAQREFS